MDVSLTFLDVYIHANLVSRAEGNARSGHADVESSECRLLQGIFLLES
jgi:hypothetical protein